MPKGTQLSPHFNEDEFRCKCGCGKVIVVPALIEALETIRDFTGIPMHITSGYRCAKHNAEVGGADDSAHLTGEAADFWVSGSKDRFRFLEAIAMYGPTRYGISPKDFIHVDVSTTLPQEVCWVYGD